MTLTLEQQLEFFDRNFDKAWARRMRMLRDPDYKALVRRTSRQRLIDNFPVYGCSMFRKPYDELKREELQEDADAPAWRMGRMYQGWPT